MMHLSCQFYCLLYRNIPTSSITRVKNTRFFHQKRSSGERSHRGIYYAAAAVALTSAGICYLNSKAERKIPFPKYSMRQITEHKTWITYAGGVYDVSQYAKLHPGGEKMILMAGGAALEPFWDEYDFHRNPEILKLLESMRIGDLDSEENNHPEQKPARCKLVKTIPRVDPKKYRLELLVEGEPVRTLKLDDVKRFPKYSIISAIPCKSSNKQSETNEAKSNVSAGPMWSGTRLRDILREFDINERDYEQVQFECMDASKSGILYGSDIPVKSAIDPEVDILLAFEMNGAEIPPEHGYPLRVVMPQLAGAKNVKWVNKIVVLCKKEGTD